MQTSVQSVLPQLADFGITGANLTKLNALITKFQTSFGSREESVANRIAARITLKALFDPIDTILKMDLDRMMELIKKDELQFYHACFPSGQSRIRDIDTIRLNQNDHLFCIAARFKINRLTLRFLPALI